MLASWQAGDVPAFANADAVSGIFGIDTGAPEYGKRGIQAAAFAEPNRAPGFRLNRLRKPLGEDPARAL